MRASKLKLLATCFCRGDLMKMTVVLVQHEIINNQKIGLLIELSDKFKNSKSFRPLEVIKLLKGKITGIDGDDSRGEVCAEADRVPPN